MRDKANIHLSSTNMTKHNHARMYSAFGKSLCAWASGSGLYRRSWTSLATKHSVALVRERTIPTELPPPFGEVSANFC